ncbi:MAG: efflux RND transporter periplasmic adaptor subunit [Chlamydiales bacterium]|nr:efflux RND transporter periplasmic adaptor subunit [Chlamydiales bacterium]
MASEEVVAAPRSRGRTLTIVTLLLALVAICIYLVYHMLYRNVEFTGDAYAGGNTVRITSVIPGTAVTIFADNNERVEEGQLLVLLDRTPYKIAYDMQLASFSSTVLQVRQMYEQLNSAKDNVEAKETLLEQARVNYDSRKGLVGSLAVSKDEFSQAENNYALAKLSLREAETQLKMAQDGIGATKLADHPRIQLARGSVRDAYYRLARCEIRAPICGYVAQRQVHVGQYLAPSAPLMSIVSCDKAWVDANFQETQLKRIRIGQPAHMTFDMFGKNVKFVGKVVGISSGTGSIFSLIPPQNATGNWIKIVQRVPVRIALNLKDRAEYPLLLGLSAEVSVDVSKTDLPRLAESTNNELVSTTDIFDVDFRAVEELLDDIVNGPTDNG